MKKKLMATIMAGIFLLGSAAGALAAGSYYTDIIDGAMEAHKQVLADEYERRSEEMDFQIKNDMILVVDGQIRRLEEESMAYLDQQLAIEQQSRMNQRTAEIEQHADQKLGEMKAYIDKLVSGKK